MNDSAGMKPYEPPVRTRRARNPRTTSPTLTISIRVKSRADAKKWAHAILTKGLYLSDPAMAKIVGAAKNFDLPQMTDHLEPFDAAISFDYTN